MINFDDENSKKKNKKKKTTTTTTQKNNRKLKSTQPQIPDHPQIILIIGVSGFTKGNLLFNLLSHQLDIDKIHLQAKDPYKVKYQVLVNK